MLFIDIAFSGIDSDTNKEGYTFVDVKKLIAVDVLDKAKIMFSKTSIEVLDDNIMRMTVFPPRGSFFEIES